MARSRGGLAGSRWAVSARARAELAATDHAGRVFPSDRAAAELLVGWPIPPRLIDAVLRALYADPALLRASVDGIHVCRHTPPAGATAVRGGWR
jgi:hypothetical protein